MSDELCVLDAEGQCEWCDAYDGAEVAAHAYSASPVFQALVRRGWASARDAGETRSPYTLKTSGQRWRTFAFAFGFGVEAYYGAEACDAIELDE